MSDLSQLQRSPGGQQFGGIRPPNGPPLPGMVPAGGAAAQATTSDAKADKASGEKKKKPVKPIALAVLVLLVGYVAKGKIVKPHYTPTEKLANGPIFDLPSITTNLADGHLAQLGISLQLTIAGSTKELTKDQSEILGSTVQVIGQQTYASLLPPTGRAALQAALLKAYQTDLGTSEGGQQVSAVYFTSFVLQ